VKRWVVLGLAAGGTLACSLLVDLSNLGNSSDAGSDAAVESGTDAIVDAAPEREAFCKTHDAVGCIDFDESDAVAPFFSSTQFDPHITTSIDTTFASSPPNSLHMTMPATVFDSGSVSSFARRTFIGTLNQRVSLSVDLYVDAVDPTIGMRLLELRMANATNTTGCVVHVSGSGCDLYCDRNPADGGSFQIAQVAFTTPIAMKAWVTVGIQVDATTSPAQAIATVNGTNIIATPISIPQNLVTGTQVAVDIGITEYQGSNVGAEDVHWDNVLVDFQ
jgi:hypothetical protein